MRKKKDQNTPVPVEEVFKKIDTPWKWYDQLWWWIRHGIWGSIRDLRWQVPNTISRAKRGWGHADIWGFCDYLANVISGGLKHLKENKCGYPCPEGKDGKEAKKEWDEALDKMIYTFETAKKVLDNYPAGEWLYIPSKDWDKQKEFRDRMLNGTDMHVMTKEECLKYEEGFRLFQEHFFNLWD